MLRLYDTARGAVVPLQPRDPGKVSMYVCGPTVYGPAHLGHGRFALVFDVLRRYLEWCGYEVDYASNITDIDDKIIERAATEGRSAEDVAEEWEAAWWRSMDAIGVARPTHDPHATAFVSEMVGLIDRLIAEGAAYETDDGVYFRADAVADYGVLARQSIESLQAGARVEVDETKRSPVDFALWKKAKEGEPSWPSPWGAGRPGWHTECVVMSLDLLGDGFDIHGGGQDLAFPHHENERAQAAALGHRFAAHWVHNGFVEVGGEKMSKSLGNFTDLDDLVARSDPRAYRLLVLRSHYRSPIEVNATVTADASAALRRLDALARRAAAWPAEPAHAETVQRFRERMDDDLDTPAVVDLMFRTLHRANQAADDEQIPEAAAAAAAVIEMASAVGLALHAEAGAVPEEVAALARQRDDARAARDWATADALREAITDAGYVVEDGAEGTVVRPG